MNTPAPQNTQSGAAMLGIVLVIVVILLALVGALAIGPQLQNITSERQTVKRANVIVDAVRQYYLARGELPDPSSVPVDKLNLEQKYRYDAWGQEWCYYRATDEVGGEPIGNITGLEVDTGSGNGLNVAGVLISSGPDQGFNSSRIVDGITSVITSCNDLPDDGTIETIIKGDDDIVIPLNVQGEATQRAKDELKVLAGRGCPIDTSGNLIDLDNDFDQFLNQVGLGDSFGRDPWWVGGDGDYNYEWHGSAIEGYWLSRGAESGQEIWSRRIVCDPVVPGDPLVALDFSQMDDLTHNHIVDAGAGASIVDSGDSDIGNVLEFDGTGGEAQNYVQLIDVENLEDICEYTIMGWYWTGTVTPSRTQVIANRRPDAGGNYNTWGIGLNADSPVLGAASECNYSSEWSEFHPPSVTRWSASRSNNHYYPLFRMDTSQGRRCYDSHAWARTGRGMGFFTDHTGLNHLDNQWRFFAVNLRTDEDTDIIGLTGSGNNQHCQVSAGGEYRSSMYVSDPGSPNRLYVTELTPDYPRGPDVGPDSPRWRNFLGRAALDSSSTVWRNAFYGQIARFYIYEANEVLNHEQIVQYYNQTCSTFTNCVQNPAYNFAAMTSGEIEDFINDPRIRSWDKDQWGVEDESQNIKVLSNIDLAGWDGQAIYIPIPDDYDEYFIRAVVRMDAGTTGTYGIFYDTTLNSSDLEDPGYRLLIDRGYGNGALQLRSKNPDGQLKAFTQVDDVPDKNTDPDWWTALHLVELELTNNGTDRNVAIRIYDLAGPGDVGEDEIWSTLSFEDSDSYAYTEESGQKYTGFRTTGVHSNFLYLEIEKYE